jgi:heme-degrading monooxygenase HmoA
MQQTCATRVIGWLTEGGKNMYARTTIAQVQPGKMAELVSILLDSVLPAARQQKGYQGGLVLTNPDTGKAEIIALWETEADMTVGEASGYYREQVAKVAHTLVGPSVREAYTVNNRE